MGSRLPTDTYNKPVALMSAKTVLRVKTEHEGHIISDGQSLDVAWNENIPKFAEPVVHMILLCTYFRPMTQLYTSDCIINCCVILSYR